jgi:hypothetical protein
MTPFYQRYDQVAIGKDFIPPRQVDIGGASTPLAVACYNLASGASTTFANSGFNNFGEGDDAALSWQTAFYHGVRTGRLHIMGKRANATQWKHAHCRLGANVWTDTGASLLFGDFGHVYGNHTIDPETDDQYILQGTFNIEKRPYKWSAATQTWALFGTPYSGATESHMNGAAVHPHLFGRNRRGLVADMQAFGFYWDLTTGAVTTWGHLAFAGEREGAGVYWPAHNCVMIGGSPVAGSGVLHRITPNLTPGGTPVVANMGVPPIPVRGGTHVGGGTFGSIHIHPGNPNKLLLISTVTQAYYTATMSGSTLTWSGPFTHPFTSTPRVVCSLKAGFGCMMSIRPSPLGVIGPFDLFRPPV